MKVIRKFKLILPLLVIILAPLKIALADVAPPQPDCTHINEKTGQPGCGYLFLSSSLDASSYEDRFVFLLENSGYEDASVTYSLTESNYPSVRRGFSDFIAVNKSYFNANGGINGIFKTVKIRAYPDDPSSTAMVESMVPKDEAAFKKYSYFFIVSKDDNYLQTDNTHLINDQYFLYYGLYADYGSTPNLSCTADNCSENLVYSPKAIIGNYILVAESQEIFEPLNANKPAPYVAPAPYIPADNNGGSQVQTIPNIDRSIVLPPQPDATSSVPVYTASEHVSWWRKFLNAIKSFFSSLFK